MALPLLHTNDRLKWSASILFRSQHSLGELYSSVAQSAGPAFSAAATFIWRRDELITVAMGPLRRHS